MTEQLSTLNQHYNFFSNHIPLDNTYQYEVLTDKYIDQVTDLFTRSFCRSEPMTHYLRMDEKKYRAFAHAVTEQASRDQLSAIALDNDRVIAIALTEDIAKPGEIIDFDPKFIYILSLLEKLGKDFFIDKNFQTGNIAHLFITAVDAEYRHKGLSKQVNFRAMDIAAQNGFDYTYCELTNYYNEKGIIPHLKHPSQLIGSCFYQDFIYEDIKPFAHLSGGANSFLWPIRDDAKLLYQKK